MQPQFLHYLVVVRAYRAELRMKIGQFGVVIHQRLVHFQHLERLSEDVRFDDVEWNRFLTMYEESNVYAKAVFLKAHFFGQKFKVLKVDKTLVDYYTKLSDFHAQFRGIGTNYNQVVKELRIHFSEKKAMALLYKLEECTIDLVKLSREIMELSREMEAKWQQRRDDSMV